MSGGANQAWYAARATGLVGWSLLAASALWGVLLASRVLGRQPNAPWLFEMHRYISSVALGFTAAHVLFVVGDTYVHFDLADVLVPFASEWRPGAVAWGVGALYLLIAVEGTSLLRRHLPLKLWQRIHLLSYPALAMATIHLLSAGTDARRLLTTAAAISLGAVVIVLMVGGVVRGVSSSRT